MIKEIDLNTATVDDYKSVDGPFSCRVNKNSRVSGFAGELVSGARVSGPAEASRVLAAGPAIFT